MQLQLRCRGGALARQQKLMRPLPLLRPCRLEFAHVTQLEADGPDACLVGAARVTRMRPGCADVPYAQDRAAHGGAHLWRFSLMYARLEAFMPLAQEQLVASRLPHMDRCASMCTVCLVVIAEGVWKVGRMAAMHLTVACSQRASPSSVHNLLCTSGTHTHPAAPCCCVLVEPCPLVPHKGSSIPMHHNIDTTILAPQWYMNTTGWRCWTLLPACGRMRHALTPVV